MRFESLEDRRLLTANVELVADLGTAPIYRLLDFPQGIAVAEGQTYFLQLIRQQSTPVGVELRRIVGDSSEVVESWIDANVDTDLRGTMYHVGSEIYFTVPVNGVDELRRIEPFQSASELVHRFDNSDSRVTQVVETDTGIFFVGSSAEFGRELYFTTGEAETTTLIDVYSGGRTFGGVFEPFSSEPSELISLGDQVVFIARNEFGDNGEVWVSDGTPENTLLLRDIAEGTDGSSPSGITRLGDQAFFTTSGPNNSGRLLWQTDGTPDGTELLSDLSFEQNEVAILGVHNEQLFYVENGEFVARSSSGRTESIASTRADTRFAFVAGSLFEFDDDELWVTDETGNSAQIHVADGPASYGGFHITTTGRFGFLTRGRELWTTNGTVDGTFQIADSSAGISHFETFAPRDFYLVRFDTGQIAVWSADWDRRGPLRSFFNASPREWVNGDNDFRIVGDVGRGPEIWISDGTPSEPTIIQPTPLGNESASATVWDSDSAETLLFFARDGALWVTDSTESGTRKIGDLPARTNPPARPELLRRVEGGIFFSLQEIDSTTSQYFASADSLRKLGDLDAEQIAPVNNKLLVVPQAANRRLLSVDLATLEIEELDSDLQSVGEISVVGDLAYFVQQRGNQWSLTVTDGTSDGTRQIDQSETQIEARNFRSSSDQVLFLRSERFSSEDQLWTTDGTAIGTRLLAAAPAGRPVKQLEQIGNRVLAFVDNGFGETEAWEFNADEGQLELKIIIESIGRIEPNQNRTHFDLVSANNDAIWISDGTDIGTHRVVSPELTTGQLEAGKLNFYVTASGQNTETGVREFSIWEIDAQTGATETIVDPTVNLVLTPGSFALENNLVFLAWDKAHGSEFRKVELSASEIPGDANADGQVDFSDFLIFTSNFGKPEDAVFAEGDFDGDGDIDFADFLLLTENFGNL